MKKKELILVVCLARRAVLEIAVLWTGQYVVAMELAARRGKLVV
jgi:hypothetical protein